MLWVARAKKFVVEHAHCTLGVHDPVGFIDLEALGKDTGMSQSSIVGQNREEEMEVDEERRKRERDESLPFQESREEPETPVPTEMAPPARPLELGDLMAMLQRNMDKTQNNFDKLDRKMSATQNEVRESKELAAKATTIASQTQTQLSALEKRVALLEKGGGGSGAQGGSRGETHTRPQNQARRDWEQLGGDEGDTLVIGGFREYASKEERRDEWDQLEKMIPDDLKAKFKEVIVPNAPCSTVLLKIIPEATPNDTRRAMLDWTKKFKEQQFKLTSPGETQERTFWAGPSKPFSMRQRDAKLNQTFDGIKLMAGPEIGGKIHIDRSNGRIFHDRTLLFQRDPETGTPEPRSEALATTIPGFTAEGLETKIAEAKAAREAGRRPP